MSAAAPGSAPVNPLRDPRDRRLPRIAGPSSVVIFGVTGDLSRKKLMPAIYDLANRGLLPPGFSLVGFGRRNWSTEEFTAVIRDAVRASARTPFSEDVWRHLAEGFRFVTGSFTDDAAFDTLAATLGRLDADRGTGGNHAFYFSIPPGDFPAVLKQLDRSGLAHPGAEEWRRVVIEKPFGHDLASARALNARLHEVLAEEQILRVDHFLGKEPVIELEYLRFANLALAQVWDRHSVSCVQITMAEDFGIDDRGAFYDAVGALRDVVQNHLLQVLALVTMEPPVGPGAGPLRDSKAEVLAAIPAADPARYVRGQYDGYLDVPGVAAGSPTETFAALRLGIDNDRWAGVPIFLRAGKALAQRVTEVRLLLHRTPPLAFLPNPTRAGANQIVLRIDPDPGLRLQIAARGEHSWRTVDLDTSFSHDLGEPLQPYERLLHCALIGEHQLFTREDSVEQTWRIVQPLLDQPTPPHTYRPGSWGPAAAEALVHGHPSWQQPWLKADG